MALIAPPEPGSESAILRLLLDQPSTCAWTTDRSLRVVWSAGAGGAALGVVPESVVGLSVDDLAARARLGAGLVTAHREALEGREGALDLPWGERIVHVVVRPRLDVSGAPAGVVTVLFDVTARRAGGVANDATTERTESLEAVGRVAGGVAHDFNNVLQTIVGYAHRLAGALPDGDVRRDDVAHILDAAERAASLTRQLLAFGNRQSAQAEVLDLGHLVLLLKPLLERMVGPLIRVETLAAPGAGFVHAEAGKIEQVLTSLALHAAEAMPKGGVLTIEARSVSHHDVGQAGVEVAPGRYVVLNVRDTSAGEEAGAVALPPPSLGLASVYGLVKESQGHIVVESEPGRGSTFGVFLPAVGGATHTSAADSGVNLAGEETILLVDDEPGVRTFVKRALEEYGYRVVEAGTVEEALSLGDGYPGLIHLLLTDVVLPGLNGTQLAARLAPMRPEMRILYMTGHADDAVVHRGVLSAGQALLVKPFTPLGLAHEVKKVLRT